MIWLRHIAKRPALAAAIAALIVVSPQILKAETKPNIGALEAGDIIVSATPITSFNRLGGDQTRFGKLEFRGGLVLSAPGVRNFGGWSGLILDPDSKAFAAVSDAGVWLTGRLNSSNGVLQSVTDARIGPLLGLDGKTLKRNRDRDAEAIALVGGSVTSGSLIVAFEQNSRLMRYDIAADGLSPSRGILEKPKGAAGMRRNNGFEAMTVLKGGPYKGSPIAISERLYDGARNHTGWIWTANGPQVLHIANIGDFEITDIASLDDGTLFVLERRFRWLEGLKMRIRWIAASDIKPGKTADGETLIEANLEYEIDNMEGLAVTRGAAGETILTLISDDNFNHFLQRTLLLQFSLNDTETAKARPQR